MSTNKKTLLAVVGVVVVIGLVVGLARPELFQGFIRKTSIRQVQPIEKVKLIEKVQPIELKLDLGEDRESLAIPAYSGAIPIRPTIEEELTADIARQKLEMIRVERQNLTGNLLKVDKAIQGDFEFFNTPSFLELEAIESSVDIAVPNF